MLLALCCLLCCMLTLTVAAVSNLTGPIDPNPQSWSKFTFPSPQVQYRACGQYTPGWLCDPARLISQNAASKLSRQLANIRVLKECACECGGAGGNHYITVAVAMVPEITGTNSEAALSDFADYLLTTRWNFDGGCGDDVVIAVSAKHNQMVTSVGAYARSAGLHRGCVQQIWEETRPYFANALYGEGLEAVVKLYKAAFLGQYYDCPNLDPPAVPFWGWIILAVGLLVLIIIIAVFICKGWCRRGAGSRKSGGSPAHTVATSASQYSLASSQMTQHTQLTNNSDRFTSGSHRVNMPPPGLKDNTYSRSFGAWNDL